MSYGNLTWNSEKNQALRQARGIGFEDVEAQIEADEVLDDFPHPLSAKYPNQRILVVRIDGYAVRVPYVFTEDGIFLKTMFPSRVSQKLYTNEENYD